MVVFPLGHQTPIHSLNMKSLNGGSGLYQQCVRYVCDSVCVCLCAQIHLAVGRCLRWSNGPTCAPGEQDTGCHQPKVTLCPVVYAML